MSSSVVQYVGTGIFALMFVYCGLIGSTRTRNVRLYNFFGSMFALYILIIGYLTSAFGFANVERENDIVIDLSRPVVQAAVIGVSTMLLMLRLHCAYISCVIVSFGAACAQLLLILTAISDEENVRLYWFVISLVTTMLVIIRTYLDSDADYYQGTGFTKCLRIMYAFAAPSYYLWWLLGPWIIEDGFGILVQSVLFLVTDIVVVYFLCIAIVHYGWSQRKMSRPHHDENFQRDRQRLDPHVST